MKRKHGRIPIWADLAKVQPIAFDPFTNSYNVIGLKVGAAWGAGKILM